MARNAKKLRIGINTDSVNSDRSMTSPLNPKNLNDPRPDHTIKGGVSSERRGAGS